MRERTGPLCFMHVQKCAGSSLRVALEAALPSGSLAPFHMEAANFPGRDFDQLPPNLRSRIAVTEEEAASIGRYKAIAGHFTLPALARHAPLERIATVVREPRARLLSHFLYLRLTVALRMEWRPLDLYVLAEGSLRDFLGDPNAAVASDNRLCRMLLHGHPLVPERDFIAGGNVEPLAEAAWDRMQRLGHIGLIEEPETVWKGIGDHFGVTLQPVRRNVTGSDVRWPGMLPVPPFGGAETLDLIERRTAVDAILYRRLATRREGEEQANRRIEAAYAEALVGFGAYTAEPSKDLRAADEALESLRRSRSWRYTAPLRRLGQAFGRGADR
jgi:hypothetical protein